MKNNHKNQTTEESHGDDVHGRTYNSKNPAVDKASAATDISAVDQQEGTMNNGETGADVFNEENEEGPGKNKTG